MDANDEDSIAPAMATVRADVGQLDLLINNAGFSQGGAVLDLSREDLRRQYETNVIAPVAVSRAALALLRAAVTNRHISPIRRSVSIDTFYCKLKSLFGFSPDLAPCAKFCFRGHSYGYALGRKIPHSAQSLNENSKYR